MINTEDLRIKKELLPIFDYTLNEFSKKVLLEIVETLLSSKEEIILRQHVLKGFLKNNNVLKNYSYSQSYLLEVYTFLSECKIEDLTKTKLKYLLLTSKKEKMKYQSKFVQLILLFHRLHSFYFSQINSKAFPESYKNKLHNLNNFFSSLNLDHYEELIRENKFKDAHVIDFSHILFDKQDKEGFLHFWEELFLFEAYLSISKGILINNFTFPTFSENNLLLDNFFHPLLNKPVLNSFQTSSNVILLTGANMSGKSTFLKAISLCVYLGHLGFAVPASKSEIPFFTGISIAINHRDDILNGYSHFMTEVLTLKNVVTEVTDGKKCFAVFDELFSGTNVEDASEICATTIQGLSKFKNSIFFISTHIQQLKEIDAINKSNVSTYYVDCELIENTPTFTYKLKKGWSDLRLGRVLFEKEGLNDLLN